MCSSDLTRRGTAYAGRVAASLLTAAGLPELITETAEEYDITVVLETHVTTTLNTPETIRRVIERTGSKRLKLNLDPCNFVGDPQTAFNLPPMLQHLFDVLGEYIATVHLKDFLLEDRFVVHIAQRITFTSLRCRRPIGQLKLARHLSRTRRPIHLQFGNGVPQHIRGPEPIAVRVHHQAGRHTTQTYGCF